MLDINEVNYARAEHLEAVKSIYNHDPDLAPDNALKAVHFGIEVDLGQRLATKLPIYKAAFEIMIQRYFKALPNFDNARAQLFLPVRLADLALSGRFAERLLPAMQRQHALETWYPRITHQEILSLEFSKQPDPWKAPETTASSLPSCQL